MFKQASGTVRKTNQKAAQENIMTLTLWGSEGHFARECPSKGHGKGGKGDAGGKTGGGKGYSGVYAQG